MPVSLLSARKPGAQRRVFLQPLVRNFPGLPAGLELRANLPLRAGERVRAAAELGLDAVNGAVYGYYYDALGRRRAKSYPGGTIDEYFTDIGSQLLVDQGSNTVITPVGFYTVDDYVWLNGRPVVLIRGKFAADWSRLPDSSGDCTRNGEPAACGIYFPVTDHIGKPVVMLDSSRKVAGAADYDPFGRVNRVTYNVDTPHPYANSSDLTIGDFRQALGGPGVIVKLRVLFDIVDTEQDHATIKDYAYLTDGDTSTSLTGAIGGYHRGSVWSPWVQPSNGRIAVKFSSDATNCCPDGSGGIDCGCGQAPTFPYKGVTTESYEYQRYQTGASPFWTPLRFQGQYFDAEADWFENWNRYYEPSIGRYLQSEPMLQDSMTVVDRAMRGGSIPAYAYALHNPLSYSDSTGLAPNKQWSCEDLKEYIDNMTKEINKRWEELKEDKLKLPICNPGAPLRDDKLGHLAIILKYHFQRNGAMIIYDAKGCGGGPPRSPMPSPFPFPDDSPFPGSTPLPFAFPMPVPMPVPIPIP